MRKLILFLMAVTAWAQYPINGSGSGGGGFTAPGGYAYDLVAASTSTVTAATHQQGSAPWTECYQSSDGEQVLPQVLNPGYLGDITLNFSPAFTGRCYIRGPGSTAGAAGNVVGPTSATNQSLACYSGITGKVISMCSNLTTVGAVPYVSASGVLNQDAALNWLTATSGLGVGGNAASGDVSSFLAKSAQTNLLASGGAHGFRDESTYTPAGAGNGGYAAFDAIPVYGGSGAQNHLRGFQSRPNYGGSGVIDEVAAFHAQPTITGAGTSTAVIGFRAQSPLGAGVITNFYGFYCDPVTRGAGNYCMYSGSTALPSYHGGKWQMGTAPQITAAGYTTYGAILGHDTTGNFLTNPNLTIVNGVLTMAYSTAKVLASATNLQLDSTSGAIIFNYNGTEKARFAPTTGNHLLGGTTDGNFKLDVQASGSAGTSRDWDQTPTVGTTLRVVRAGAGQSGNLQEWQNNAGTGQTVITSTGSVFTGPTSSFAVGNSTAFSTFGAFLGQTALALASGSQVLWASSTDAAGAKDLGLARNAAGILEVNNGTAGTYRAFRAGGYIAGVTSKTAQYDPTQFDYTILGDTTGGSFSIRLPNAPVAGTIYNVKKIAAGNTLTITTVGGTVTIDGSTSIAVTVNNTNMQMQFDGTNYRIL